MFYCHPRGDVHNIEYYYNFHNINVLDQINKKQSIKCVLRQQFNIKNTHTNIFSIYAEKYCVFKISLNKSHLNMSNPFLWVP